MPRVKTTSTNKTSTQSVRTSVACFFGGCSQSYFASPNGQRRTNWETQVWHRSLSQQSHVITNIEPQTHQPHINTSKETNGCSWSTFEASYIIYRVALLPLVLRLMHQQSLSVTIDVAFAAEAPVVVTFCVVVVVGCVCELLFSKFVREAHTVCSA